jgi:hypothetical protein
MLDLKNLGVTEMTNKEKSEVDGGCWFLLVYFVIGICIGLIEGNK